MSQASAMSSQGMEPSLSHHQSQYGVASGEAGKAGWAPLILIGPEGAARTEPKLPRAARRRKFRTAIFADAETETDSKDG